MCVVIVEAINSSISHIITLYGYLMVSSFIRSGVAHPIRQFNITKCSHICVCLYSAVHIYGNDILRLWDAACSLYNSRRQLAEPHLLHWAAYNIATMENTPIAFSMNYSDANSLRRWILSCWYSTSVPCLILPCEFYSLLSSALQTQRISDTRSHQSTTKRVKKRKRESARE